MRKFFRNYFANKSPLFVANSADLPAKWYFLYIFITAYWGFSLSICLSEGCPVERCSLLRKGRTGTFCLYGCLCMLCPCLSPVGWKGRGGEGSIKGNSPESEVTKWHSVKRIAPQCPSLRQNARWWPGNPFSGNSPNPLWCRSDGMCFLLDTESPGRVLLRMLSDRMTVQNNTVAIVVFRDKLEVNECKLMYRIANCNVSLRQQGCLPDETILFHVSNNIVWRVKHKCFMHQTILFE